MGVVNNVPCTHLTIFWKRDSSNCICAVCLEEFDSHNGPKPPSARSYESLLALKASLPCEKCGGSGTRPQASDGNAIAYADLLFCDCAVGQRKVEHLGSNK